MREIHKIKRINIQHAIINHIVENLKLYIIVITIFIIGIVAGVIFINNTNNMQMVEIQNYINNFVESLKNNYHIDKLELLKSSITDNFVLTIAMWFIGSTVIGIPIIFGIVIYRGFCIGYTVSAIVATLGVQKGILFLVSTIFLQNIIFIPVIICMTISCIKLYKSIMKDRRRENIKLEIVRHTISSVIFFVLLLIATIVEVYVSSNILMLSIKIF